MNAKEPSATSPDDALQHKLDEVARGGGAKYHEKNAESGKLFARERIARLFDADSFVEDALLANCEAEDLPADGVITGVGRIGGRSIAVMANDSTVKAGSWGKRTVEKILRASPTRSRCSRAGAGQGASFTTRSS
jgi:acetyl-CoA carboxylase carboxyltransferase component